MKATHMKKITAHDLDGVCNNVYSKVNSTEKEISGFHITAARPLNPNILAAEFLGTAVLQVSNT